MLSCKSPCPVRAPPGPCKSPQAPSPPQEGWALSSPPPRRPSPTPRPEVLPSQGAGSAVAKAKFLSLSLSGSAVTEVKFLSLSLSLSIPLAVLLQKPSSCPSLSLSLCLSQCCFRSGVPVFQRPAAGRHHGTPHHHPEPCPRPAPRPQRLRRRGAPEKFPEYFYGSERGYYSTQKIIPQKFCYVIATGVITGFSCRAPENNSKIIFSACNHFDSEG